MSKEQRTEGSDRLDEARVVSSGIELDRDFVPAEVTRTAQPAPMPEGGGNGQGFPPSNVANNSNVINMATTVNVGGPNIVIMTRKQQVPFVLRALWFLAIGRWLSGVFIFVGYLCCVTVVLAPVGFWFLNRVPQAQTLRMRNTEFHTTQKDGVTHLIEGRTQQLPWYYRAIYFPFGLVLGALWLLAAWALSVLIITLPLSVWMIDRSPTIISLQKN
jgi:uncharacterized membrane protein YccF (DUF307 family)